MMRLIEEQERMSAKDAKSAKKNAKNICFSFAPFASFVDPVLFAFHERAIA